MSKYIASSVCSSGPTGLWLPANPARPGSSTPSLISYFRSVSRTVAVIPYTYLSPAANANNEWRAGEQRTSIGLNHVIS